MVRRRHGQSSSFNRVTVVAPCSAVGLERSCDDIESTLVFRLRTSWASLAGDKAAYSRLSLSCFILDCHGVVGIRLTGVNNENCRPQLFWFAAHFFCRLFQCCRPSCFAALLVCLLLVKKTQKNSRKLETSKSVRFRKSIKYFF